LGALVESFLAELPQRLQEPVAGVVAGPVGDDHRLVDERGQITGDVDALDPVVGADRLGGGKVEAAGEHRQSVEQHPLRLGEKPVRPLHRRRKGVVALQPAASAAQQPESIMEPLGQVGRGHEAHPRRGQLDRKRDSVEAFADLGDHGQVALRG
jgi:hypothetical protein